MIIKLSTHWQNKDMYKGERPITEAAAVGDEIRDDEKYLSIHTTEAAVRLISSRAWFVASCSNATTATNHSTASTAQWTKDLVGFVNKRFSRVCVVWPETALGLFCRNPSACMASLLTWSTYDDISHDTITIHTYTDFATWLTDTMKDLLQSLWISADADNEIRAALTAS